MKKQSLLKKAPLLVTKTFIHNSHFAATFKSIHKKIHCIGLLFLFCFLYSGVNAQSWYNSSWSYRKAITIDYTKVGSTGAPHSSYPVLVSLTSDAGLSSNARSNGFDILFTSSDGTTKLDHQRVSYSSGTLQAWVEIPSLSASSNTVIYMYYGNSSASDQQSAESTWNSNYKGVWHLEETSGTFYDATSNNKDGSDYVSATNKNGKVGSGQQLDGSNDYISLGSGCFTTWATTVEFWVKPNSPANYNTVFTQGYNGCGSIYYRIFWYNNHFEVLIANQGTAGTPQRATGTVTNGVWTHVAYVFNGSTFTTYVNGSASSGSVSAYNVGLNGQDYIGSRNTGNNFKGSLDEMRVSNTARSAGWIKTDYNNQNSPSTFYSLGSEEEENTTAAWYDCSWKYRKTITIDKTKVGSTGAPHSSFPMFVKLTSDADLSAFARSDGYDILFTSSNGTTKLDHERMSYSSGSLQAWVEVPSVSASANTVIYMYYGNASASDQQNATAAWNSNYKGIWHMEETSGNFYDATSNNVDGTDWVSATGKEGKVGSGQQFDGTDDYINLGTGCNTTGATTIEFWVKPSSPPNYNTVFIQGSSGCGSRQYRIYWLNGKFEVRTATNGASGSGQASTASVSDGVWSHIAWVFNGSSSHTFYVNGSASSSTPAVTNMGLEGYNYIGKRNLTNHWDGSLDEIRLSNTARSAGWIQTAYNNQNSPSTFYSVSVQDISTFYSQGNQAVNTVGNWNTARDGSGTDASCFCSGTWVIQNGHSMTLTGSNAWSVTGKVQIESGGSWTNSSSGTVTLDSLQVDNGGAYNHSTTASVPGTTKVFGASSTMNYSKSGAQSVEGLAYGDLTVSGSGTKTLSGTATVAGDFEIDGTSTDFTNNGSLTVSGNFINDNDLTNSSSGILTINGTVTTANNSIITNNGLAKFYGEVTNNGTVNNTDSLHLFDYFVSIQSKDALNNTGKVILYLNADYFSGVISSLSGDGDYVVNLFLEGGGWHMVATPVDSAQISTFSGDATYTYNESSGSYTLRGSSDYMLPVEGYYTFTPNDRTVSFVGDLNTGTYSKTITNASTGFHLVGNPFMSTIDWLASSGYTKNKVSNAVYVWSKDLQTYDSYINGTGTNGGSRYIPPAQAFWIEHDGSGNGTFSLTNDVKIKNKSKKHRGDDEAGDVIRLTLKSLENGYADETVIRFNQEATDSFDKEFDARKFFSSNRKVPQLYTMAKSDKMSINTIDKINDQLAVPLFAKAAITGRARLSVSLENFPTCYYVYLEDKKEKLVYDLLTATTYEFDADAQDADDRFVIHFGMPQQINDTNLTDVKNEIYQKPIEDAVSMDGISPSDKLTSVQNKQMSAELNIFTDKREIVIQRNSASPFIVDVYSTVGKLILHKNSSGYESRIKLHNADGIYIVKVSDKEGSVSRKVNLSH